MAKFNQPSPSPILVFAVGGPIGSGCSFVRNELRNCLTSYGYQVTAIDVTDVFLEQSDQYLGTPNVTPEIPGRQTATNQPKQRETPDQRTRRLQECGNMLRERWGTEIIAALCVSEVILPDIEKNEILRGGKRQAYIIDSVKHPDEVRFLRSVFQEAFCMVGVVASERTRRDRLCVNKGFDSQAFREASRIDADEDGREHGQKAIHAVTESDYFFANDYDTIEGIQREANRLLKLIFGTEVQSPRRDEFGMQAAFNAAARSTCLSRQVGAAILDEKGHILATGHNDVPCFGGGLYGPESNPDKRCFSFGRKCYNDGHKSGIVDSLVGELINAGLLREDAVRERVETIIRNAGIKHLIEFSRAVHAEMEAIIAVARAGAHGLVGSTLYCTTFPCHNCAKHIIDAGIAKVVYIEPYEKSLARDLHSDAIYAPSDQPNGNKVSFSIFEGVSPTRYNDYFRSSDKRKENGLALDRSEERRTLLPMGAQNRNDLQTRLKRVNEKIKEVFNLSVTNCRICRLNAAFGRSANGAVDDKTRSRPHRSCFQDGRRQMTDHTQQTGNAGTQQSTKLRLPSTEVLYQRAMARSATINSQLDAKAKANSDDKAKTG